MFGIDDDKTTYAMTVIGEKHSVRAVVGTLNNKPYSQAQAWNDNQWKYLCIDYPAVYFCETDKNFIPTQFYNPQIWMMRMEMTMMGPR